MPGRIRSSSFGVIVPSIRSPLTTTRLIPASPSCGIIVAQGNFTGLLAGRNRLVLRHHRLFAMEVGEVAGDKHDPAAGWHQWHRLFDQVNLGIAVQPEGVGVVGILFQPAAGIQDQEVESPEYLLNRFHHGRDGCADR